MTDVVHRWLDGWFSTGRWLGDWSSTHMWLDGWCSTHRWLDGWCSTGRWLDGWCSTHRWLDGWQLTRAGDYFDTARSFCAIRFLVINNVTYKQTSIKTIFSGRNSHFPYSKLKTHLFSWPLLKHTSFYGKYIAGCALSESKSHLLKFWS